MLKEIKYFIFIFIICLFLFLTGRYYFSDANKKNSYRSLQNIDQKINTSKTIVRLQKTRIYMTSFIYASYRV